MPEPQPTYILPQKKARLILPKIISFLFLGIIFYLGVLLNLSLLNITTSTEKTIKLISIILLSIIVIFGFIFNLVKSKQKYFFYQNRILFGKKQILLREITDIKNKQNFLDKIFKTHSLILNQKFKINHIPQQINLQNYLQKLITYSKNRSV
ncbi:hypothetical protein GOV03_03260 [Candidatus Woesearchaeota archaeon]|nr:hypothetical protein [Candidatus Woesearchaeota archaeon]